MAIHMVVPIAGVEFQVTLSRDDADNYVAEAARVRSEGTEAPRVRVVDPLKERALSSLYDSLSRLTADDQARRAAEGPSVRPAA